MICPSCHGDCEAPAEDTEFTPELGLGTATVSFLPCPTCCGSGEVPDLPDFADLPTF